MATYGTKWNGVSYYGGNAYYHSYPLVRQSNPRDGSGHCGQLFCYTNIYHDGTKYVIDGSTTTQVVNTATGIPVAYGGSSAYTKSVKSDPYNCPKYSTGYHSGSQLTSEPYQWDIGGGNKIGGWSTSSNTFVPNSTQLTTIFDCLKDDVGAGNMPPSGSGNRHTLLVLTKFLTTGAKYVYAVHAITADADESSSSSSLSQSSQSTLSTQSSQSTLPTQSSQSTLSTQSSLSTLSTLSTESSQSTLSSESSSSTISKPVRVAKGTATDTNNTNTITSSSNVTLNTGDSLIVMAATGGSSPPTVSSIMWGSTALSQDKTQIGDAGIGRLDVWSVHSVTGGTDTITVTFSGNNTNKFLIATAVTGITGKDQAVSTNSYLGAPNSTASPTTTKADEYICGYCLAGAAGTGWTNSFSDGQAVNYLTTYTNEGYRFVGATGSYTATRTGSYSGIWIAAEVTYFVSDAYVSSSSSSSSSSSPSSSSSSSSSSTLHEHSCAVKFFGNSYAAAGFPNSAYDGVYRPVGIDPDDCAPLYSDGNGHYFWNDCIDTGYWVFGPSYGSILYYGTSNPVSSTWYDTSFDPVTGATTGISPVYGYTPSTTALDGLTQFTIEGWFKTTATTDGMLLGSTDNWQTSSGHQGFLINWSGTTFYMRYYTGSGWVDGIGANIPAVSNGNWHHFAWTNNGTNTKMWFDGVLKGTSTIDGTLSTGNSKLVIGAAYDLNNTDQFDYNFNGTLDQIRISNIAKYTSDFSSNLPTNLNADGDTIVFYPMHECGGSTLYDDGPNGLNVTLAGSPIWGAGRELLHFIGRFFLSFF